jgi:hypothetical protein
MKFTLKSKDLKEALKVALAILSYSGKSEHKPCILRSSEKGLELETARSGASVVCLMPGTLLREGEAGIDLEQLAGFKSLGPEATLDLQHDKLVITSGRSTFKIPVVDRAVEDVTAQRVDKFTFSAKAKVPVGLLKTAALYSTYSTSNDFRLQVMIGKGTIRCAGIDHVSGGRVLAENHDDITATKTFEFIVPSDLWGSIVESLEGKFCQVSLAETAGVVVLRCANLTVAHPILDQQCIPIDKHFDGIIKQDALTSVTLENQALREGVDAIAPAAKQHDTTLLQFGKDKARISAASEDTTAQHSLKDPIVKGKAGEARVFYGHLTNISKKLPNGLQVTLKLFDEKFLYLTAETEPLKIDYLIQQRDA